MQRKSGSKKAPVLSVLVIAIATCAWAGPKYHVLYNFQGGKDGTFPIGALVSDAAGNLYGVTTGGGLGGNGGCGTIFELVRRNGGWVHKVLYRFPGKANEGCYPYANLESDGKGNLYGTTESGGGQGNCSGETCGTVFELAPVAGDKWKATVLHRFAGGQDGAIPIAGVVLDKAGNVYGTTTDGGGTSCGCGTVFELTPMQSGGWNEKIIHSFSGSDGANPFNVIFDGVGNLYGVGDSGGLYDVGVAFELSPSGGGTWNESVIYDFSSDGEFPLSGLTFNEHNLYGATAGGGAGNWGTVFELKHESNGNWSHSVLYSFSGHKDGRTPLGSPVFDKSGNLYSSTGGDVSCVHQNRWGCGNVFKLTHANGQWRITVLHTFTGGDSGGGAFPSQPMFGTRGHLYGVAYQGGDGQCGGGEWSGCGVVFEITP